MSVSGLTLSKNVTMSFERIRCFAAQLAGFPRNREFMPDVLMLLRNQARGSPKRGKFGPILKIPC
jgi:hypothetical protein